MVAVAWAGEACRSYIAPDRYLPFLFDVFQTCGRAELKFIVDMGLWGGMALGVVQMGFWLLWSPKWTLSAGASIHGACFYICVRPEWGLSEGASTYGPCSYMSI